MNTAMARMAKAMRVLNALRYPNYRSYWFGNLASVSGFQIMMMGQGWLVYELTGSPLYLGYVGLATAIPSILLNLFGGVFADKLNPRRLVLLTQPTSAILMFTLGTLTVLDVVQVWHVMIVAFCTGAVQAFDQPARQSMYPHLLDRKDLMNAVALNSSIWQGTRIVAPSIGGAVIGLVGNHAPFYLAGLGFLTMSLLISRINVSFPVRVSGGSVAQDMVEGISFIRNNSIFSFLIGMTFFNSFFGLAYTQLMPIFAEDILDVGASGMGFLLSVSGVGALLGTFVIASMGDVRRKGLLLIGGATLFGGSLILFALSHWFFVSLGILFVAGFSNSVYSISVMSTLQIMVPDELRGRVMGVYGMTYNMLPLGAMQSGAIANVASAPFAVALGGFAVIAFALGVASTNVRIRRLGVAT